MTHSRSSSGSPKITFAVPVYNVRPYLEKCLLSLEAQTDPDFEVVMVDDGSTDGSGDICRRFAEKDRRFRYHWQENAWLAAARNRAISLATGRYVMFLDSDDYLDRDFCRTIAGSDGFGETDLIVFGVRMVYPESGRETVASLPEEKWLSLSPENHLKHFCVDWLMPRQASYATNKCYRRELLLEHEARFPDEVRFAEDRYFNYLLLPWVRSVSYLSYAPYYYVQQEQSACFTVARSRNIIKYYLWVYARATAYWERIGWRVYDSVKPIVLMRALQAAFFCTMQAVGDHGVMTDHALEAFAGFPMAEELDAVRVEEAVRVFGDLCRLSWAERSKMWLFALSVLGGREDIVTWQRMFPGYVRLAADARHDREDEPRP